MWGELSPPAGSVRWSWWGSQAHPLACWGHGAPTAPGIVGCMCPISEVIPLPLLQLEELSVMESTGQEETACPTCSSNVSTRLGKLLQRYEKLQGLVDSLMSSKKRGKVVRELPGKSQVGRWQHGGLWEGCARTMPGCLCFGVMWWSSLLPPTLSCKVCSIEGDSSHAANVLLALRAYGHWPSKPGLSPWGSQPTLRGTTLLFSSPEQDQEALKRVQAAILQMQGEYEKLNSVTGRLLDDSRQQQKDIEVDG